jgi:hypothetical protein
MGRTVIVVPGSQGTTMSLSVCRCDGAGYSSWVGVRVVVYTNVCPCYTLAYLRTEDRRFGIKLKEEGRIAIVSKVLGRSGGDAKRCMKTAGRGRYRMQFPAAVAVQALVCLCDR